METVNIKKNVLFSGVAALGVLFGSVSAISYGIIKSFEQREQDFEEKIVSLESTLGANSGRITNLESSLNKSKFRVEELQGRFNELSAEQKKDVNEFKSLLGFYDAKLSQSINQYIDELKLIKDTSTNKAQEQEARSSALQKYIVSLETIIAQMKEETGQKFNSVVLDLQREINYLKETIKSVRGPDSATLIKNIIVPTVQVNNASEIGSGTIIYSQSVEAESGISIFETYVLTAYHVLYVEESKDVVDLIEVKVYPQGNFTDYTSIKAKVIAGNQDLDVAVLKLESIIRFDAAKSSSREELSDLKAFTKVYASGCPLGYAPLPTSGEISTMSKELKGRTYWMINAPTIFGNSGGGIFSYKTQHLIGVLSRVSAYNNFINIAVPHMGILVPMNQIYDWMEKNDLKFLIPEETAENKGD